MSLRSTYAMLVAYRGDLFHGFQQQGALATVELALRDAMRHQQGCAPHGWAAAGRTDAGVHALGQVVSFSLRPPVSPADLLETLNARLPPGIWVRSLVEVPRRFHARATAISKWYRYVLVDRGREPESLRHAWALAEDLDAAAMARAARALIGQRDFTSFRAASCKARGPLCHVHEVEVRRRDTSVVIDLRADRFLRRMARAMVGLLVEVGLGQRRSDSVAATLDAARRDAAGRTAPARGLYLMMAGYPAEISPPFDWEPSSLGSSKGASIAATLSWICFDSDRVGLEGRVLGPLSARSGTAATSPPGASSAALGLEEVGEEG